jgi:hypothetical protein
MVARRVKKPGADQPPLDGPDFRRLMDGRLSEAAWQKQVEERLTVFGWWWLHIPPNVVVCTRCHTKIYRGIEKGFPDIFAIKPPYMLWLELKAERGHLETEQRRVGAMLKACGQTFVQARPRDRERVLQLITHPEVHVL